MALWVVVQWISTRLFAVGMSVEEGVGGYFYVRGFEARVGGCTDGSLENGNLEKRFGNVEVLKPMRS